MVKKEKRKKGEKDKGSGKVKKLRDGKIISKKIKKNNYEPDRGKLDKKIKLKKIPEKNKEELRMKKDEKAKPEKKINIAAHENKKGKGNVLEKYDIEVDGAKVRVEIKKTFEGITYNLYVPEINIATSALLNEIRNELISITTISMKEITDPKAFLDIKKRFMFDAQKLLKTKLPNMENELERFLIGKLMQDMMGLGKIEFLINDPNLEEVVIPSSKEPIRVY